jgi:hypothetical protein
MCLNCRTMSMFATPDEVAAAATVPKHGIGARRAEAARTAATERAQRAKATSSTMFLLVGESLCQQKLRVGETWGCQRADDG